MTDRELLGRIDERTLQLSRNMSELRDEVAAFGGQLDRFVERDEFDRRINGFVPYERFQIVQALVFGFAALVLTAFAGALVAQVVSS